MPLDRPEIATTLQQLEQRYKSDRARLLKYLSDYDKYIAQIDDKKNNRFVNLIKRHALMFDKPYTVRDLKNHIYEADPHLYNRATDNHYTHTIESMIKNGLTKRIVDTKNSRKRILQNKPK